MALLSLGLVRGSGAKFVFDAEADEAIGEPIGKIDIAIIKLYRRHVTIQSAGMTRAGAGPALAVRRD